MKHISSRDNPAVKALVKLAGAVGKRGAPVLLDGVHLCQAWLQHHGARPTRRSSTWNACRNPISRPWPRPSPTGIAWPWTRG